MRMSLLDTRGPLRRSVVGHIRVTKGGGEGHPVIGIAGQGPIWMGQLVLPDGGRGGYRLRYFVTDRTSEAGDVEQRLLCNRTEALLTGQVTEISVGVYSSPSPGLGLAFVDWNGRLIGDWGRNRFRMFRMVRGVIG